MYQRLARNDGLVRGTPRESGVDANEIMAFLDDAAAAGLELHSLLLHRRDRLVLDAAWWPYRTDKPRITHSVTKSFLACAIGMALEEGRFALSDKVVSFFPMTLAGRIDPKLAAMTIEDLLTMRCGHEAETSGSVWRGKRTSWIDEFFKIPVVHQPGTVHVYTSAASYMLSAILTKATGETLHDYLRPRLFDPLGITGERWDSGPDGFTSGGNGLTCTPVDLLKLGILHARKGVWEGKRILSEDWIERATRPQGDPSYGYHWWVGADGSYSAQGIFVQLVIVFPKAQAALALTGAMKDSAQVMPLIDRHIARAFHDGRLPDRGADSRLSARLGDLTRRPALRKKRESTANCVSGSIFKVDPNPLGIIAFRIYFLEESYVFTLYDANGAHDLVGSVGRWIETDASLPGSDLHHGYELAPARILAGAQWLGSNLFEMTWIFVETAFRDTVICRFNGNAATFERRVNTNSGALAWPTLIGCSGSQQDLLPKPPLPR